MSLLASMWLKLKGDAPGCASGTRSQPLRGPSRPSLLSRSTGTPAGMEFPFLSPHLSYPHPGATLKSPGSRPPAGWLLLRPGDMLRAEVPAVTPRRTQVLDFCGSSDVLEHRSSGAKEGTGRLWERIRLEPLWPLARGSFVKLKCAVL